MARAAPDDGAALGWRSHSGWAVLVAVTGTARAPTVVARQRVELVDASLPRQPYHAAAGRTLGAAAALIAKVEAAAAAAAADATKASMAALATAGHPVVAAGVVGGGRRLPDDLVKILGAHALLHSAEGDLYEQALAEAAARVGLPVSLIPLKTVITDAAAALHTTATALDAALKTAGRTLGPPWQKDHREAAAAALAALAAVTRAP